MKHFKKTASIEKSINARPLYDSQGPTIFLPDLGELNNLLQKETNRFSVRNQATKADAVEQYK